MRYERFVLGYSERCSEHRRFSAGGKESHNFSHEAIPSSRRGSSKNSNSGFNPCLRSFAIEPTLEISTPSSHPARIPQIISAATSMTSEEVSQRSRSRSRSPSRSNRVFVCFGCYEEGHFLMDCPFLSAEQRKIFQDAQKSSKQHISWGTDHGERHKVEEVRQY